MSGHIYVPHYYDAIAAGSLRSAERVLPIVRDAVAPLSVLDVGCGVGTWLAAWRGLGVEDIYGVDGDYVDREQLHIPADAFGPANLEKPLDLARRFDLVMSLEVAEHLAPGSEATFVETLTRHGDVVLFSAAIPNQGGEHHVNEQWPEHWAGYFARFGYLPVDLVRPRVWNDPAVEFWYAQNALVFVRADRLDDFPALRAELVAPDRPLGMVHPRQWIRHQPAPPSRATAGAQPFMVVADAAEVIEDPELLTHWAAEAPEGATLIVFAPDGDPAAVEAGLHAAYARAEIDPATGPDVEALVAAEQEGVAALVATASAAYGRASLVRPLDRLPQFSAERLADLRTLASVTAH